MTVLAIDIQHLHKTYPGGFEALKGITLTVDSGEFFGLLGPNGAGKSTTIGIISSLVNKTSGQVRVCGHDIDTDLDAAKSMLGVVPQEFNFSIFEPCFQILVQQAGYYGISYAQAKTRAMELLDQLELSEKATVPAGRLSGGQKRRLMIARALVHQPKILILDEPTAGVDISMRRSMWTFLTQLNQAGTTIILTTHNLDEAESLCKRIAIIDGGAIIENLPTTQLLDRLKSEIVVFYVPISTPIPTMIEDLPVTSPEPGVIEIDITQSWTITQVVDCLAKQGVTVNRVRNKANRLEELFIKLVGSR